VSGQAPTVAAVTSINRSVRTTSIHFQTRRDLRQQPDETSNPGQFMLAVATMRAVGHALLGVGCFLCVGLGAAPGVALIWQHGDFELGLGTRYVVAPIDSFQLTLMSGVRF